MKLQGAIENLYSNPPPPFSMASESETNIERFKSENHSAFIVGYTGEIGKALVQDLDKQKIFKRVVLIGRRVVPLNVGSEFVSTLSTDSLHLLISI